MPTDDPKTTREDKAMEIAEALYERFWIQDGVDEDSMHVERSELADFIRPLLTPPAADLDAARAAGVAEGIKKTVDEFKKHIGEVATAIEALFPVRATEIERRVTHRQATVNRRDTEASVASSRPACRQGTAQGLPGVSDWR